MLPCVSSAPKSDRSPGFPDSGSSSRSTRIRWVKQIRVVRSNFKRFNQVLSGEESEDCDNADPRGVIESVLAIWKEKFDAIEHLSHELAICFGECDSHSNLQLKTGGHDSALAIDQRLPDFDARSAFLSTKSPSTKNMTKSKNFYQFDEIKEMNRQQSDSIDEKDQLIIR
jgi:hypothetical protein